MKHDLDMYAGYESRQLQKPIKKLRLASELKEENKVKESQKDLECMQNVIAVIEKHHEEGLSCCSIGFITTKVSDELKVAGYEVKFVPEYNNDYYVVSWK